MKKFFSIDYSNRLGVLVKSNKNRYILKDTYDFSEISEGEFLLAIEKSIKKYKTILSFEYNEFINQKVELPKVKDTKTLEFLIKSKISNELKPNKKYKFIYFPIQEIENKVIYDVFAIPIDTLLKQIKIDYSLIKLLDKFLISQFSLLGLSNKVFNNKAVFHAYGDKNKIIITVSKGTGLKYTRTVYIDTELSEEHRNNIFYENINLTYQYVTQNKTKHIDYILFSGELIDSFEVIQSSYMFLNKPIAVILPSDIISGCDTKTFHKFLVPIGNLFVPDDFNILPDEFIQEKIFNQILIYGNMFLFILIILFSFLDFSKFSSSNQKLSLLDKDYRKFTQEISSFRKEFGISVNNLEFFANYFNKLSEIKENDLLKNLFDFKYFLKNFNLTNFKIDKNVAPLEVQIAGTKSFNDLKSFVKFKEKLQNEIQKLSNKYIVQDNTQYIFQQLKIILNISLVGK